MQLNKGIFNFGLFYCAIQEWAVFIIKSVIPAVEFKVRGILNSSFHKTVNNISNTDLHFVYFVVVIAFPRYFSWWTKARTTESSNSIQLGLLELEAHGQKAVQVFPIDLENVHIFIHAFIYKLIN